MGGAWSTHVFWDYWGRAEVGSRVQGCVRRRLAGLCARDLLGAARGTVSARHAGGRGRPCQGLDGAGGALHDRRGVAFDRRDQLVGLDTDGAQGFAPSIPISYSIGGLPPDKLFHLVFWNATGEGTNQDIGFVDSGPDGVLRFSAPLDAVFAATSAALGAQS